MIPTEIINRYLKGFVDVAELFAHLHVQVEDCNLILSDLDHFLELEDLENLELANIVIRRKQTLIDRRKSKDMVRVIDQILPKQTEGRTTQDRYEYAIRNLDARVYTPRKITFEDAIQPLAKDDV